MGMIKRGGDLDVSRAAEYFVRWWRGEGGLIAASEAQALLQRSDTPEASVQTPLQLKKLTTGVQGWGFDLEWEVRSEDVVPGVDLETLVQRKMERSIDEHMVRAEKEEKAEGNLSDTQKRKQMAQEEKLKRKMKHLRRSS